MGAPFKIPTHEELVNKIQNYFDSITIDEPVMDGVKPVLNNADEPLVHTQWLEIPMTIAMCLYIGIDDETLTTYEKRGQDFSDTIQRARKIILSRKLQSLYTSKNTRGVQFDLAVNHGMIEKKAIDNTTTLVLPEKTPEEVAARIAELTAKGNENS